MKINGSHPRPVVVPQQSYHPKHIGAPDSGRQKLAIERYGVPQMVHLHAHGESCNERCYGLLAFPKPALSLPIFGGVISL